jgi:hypothetical protein
MLHPVQQVITSSLSHLGLQIQRFRAAVAKTARIRCTKSCHPAVNQLHSAENKPHKIVNFPLTQNLKGVELNRSLTVS